MGIEKNTRYIVKQFTPEEVLCLQMLLGSRIYELKIDAVPKETQLPYIEVLEKILYKLDRLIPPPPPEPPTWWGRLLHSDRGRQA